MKNILTGTLVFSLIIGTKIMGNQDIQINNKEAENLLANTNVNFTEITETQNKVFAYKPKAICDNMVISEMYSDSTDFGTPTTTWEITYVKDDVVAPVGIICEFDKNSIDTSSIDTDIYDVFEGNEHVYIAKADESNKLYFSENSMETTIVEQYKETLINLLEPYEIDASVNIVGINSKFVFTIPEGVTVSAYNTDEHCDDFADKFTLYYNPLNEDEAPQKVMEIISTTENLNNGYVKVLNSEYDVYTKVCEESTLTNSVDIENYNDIVDIFNNKSIMEKHIQLTTTGNTYNNDVVVIDEVYNNIEYKILKDEKVFVPFTETFEQLGYEVLFDNKNETINIVKNNMVSKILIEDEYYLLSLEENTIIEAKPIIIENTIYVPIELLNEILSFEIVELLNNKYAIN